MTEARQTISEMKKIYGVATLLIFITIYGKPLEFFFRLRSTFFSIYLVIGASGVKAPVWSNVYSVKGILHIPYAEIDEPFYTW